MTVCVLPVFLVVMGVYVEYTHTDGCSTLTVSHESLLVEYGEPVELNCSIPSKPPSSQHILGWESQINPVQTDSETSVMWRSPGLTQWEVNGRELFCFLTVPNKEQCKKRVHLSLYRRPDSVKISSESSVWSEGQMMKLKCEIKNVGPLQNLTVQWTRVDQNKNRTVTEMSYGNFSSSGEERKSGDVTATLNVSASRDEDGVQYQCAALLKLVQLQQPQVGTSEPLNITVHYKPSISRPSGGVESVIRGDELVLNCSAHGNPSPQYTWSSPGNMNLMNSSILIISTVGSEDQGQYSCTAYNDKGSDSVTVTVNVLEHPHTTNLSSVSNVWSEGQMMKLNCEIKNTGPVQNLTVQWTRVDQNKNRTVTEMSYGNFSISEKQKGSVDATATLEVLASRDEDGVQYQCAALLKLEQLQQPQVGTSEPLNITVHYKPSISRPSGGVESVIRGDELVLNCSAHGNPSPQYTWSSPGNMNLMNSSILIISTVGSEDQGQYSCTAYNDKGSDSVTVTVNVLEHPHTTNLSSVSNVWSEGQMMKLKCEIKNTGPVQNLTVQWTKVDQNKNRTVTEMSYGNFSISKKQKGSVDVTATLEVLASRDEDGVQYQCAALLKLEQLQQPQVGTSEPLKITVHYKPSISRPSGGVVSVIRGDELVLNCSAHGNPSPQYTWSSPGNMNLMNSSILIISTVGSEDQGQYSCTAYNDKGSDSVTVRVNVVVDYKLIIIAICAVVTVVLIIGFSFWCYQRTQNIRRNHANLLAASDAPPTDSLKDTAC
ncbi:carcinoembryonic antigen-related cell adhesion molecule 20-like [Colossoma macropomum]|uniref:carcinoembryonic antigen-related cell adhesion molecule 20-like n=1 Tax=Colossoma macropomum TaxID=42526 RepID=UPI00186437E5|nr:carcinoembryonic antigen-related cell adhesion molecule 20-like [Colossoma macropomum]